MCGCSPVVKSFFDTHRTAGSFVHVSGLSMRRIFAAGRYGVLGFRSRSVPRTHVGPLSRHGFPEADHMIGCSISRPRTPRYPLRAGRIDEGENLPDQPGLFHRRPQDVEDVHQPLGPEALAERPEIGVVGCTLVDGESAEPAGGHVVPDEPLHFAVGTILDELEDQHAQAALGPDFSATQVGIASVHRLREDAEIDYAIVSAVRMLLFDDVIENDHRLGLVACVGHFDLLSRNLDSAIPK